MFTPQQRVSDEVYGELINRAKHRYSEPVLNELFIGFNVHTDRSYAIAFIDWLVGLREEKPKLTFFGTMIGVMHKEAAYIRGNILKWVTELDVFAAVDRDLGDLKHRDTTWNE